MTDAVVTNLGQRQLSGDEQELFRDQFAGEVLTSYDETRKLNGTVRSRDIDSGKSATFNAIDTASAGYHTAGTEILGTPIGLSDITLTIDDEVIADTFIAKIHEAKNHYDVRAPFSAELGKALARFDDRNIARNILLAARGGELFTGDGGGEQIINASFASDFGLLADAVYSAKEAMENKNVDVETQTVFGAFRPTQWYGIARAEKVQNGDYGGGGAYASGTFEAIGGATIMKSNALPFGRDDTDYNASTNTDGTVGNPNAPYNKEPLLPAKYQGDWTNTVGMVWTQDAAAILNLLGMDMDMTWDARRRGYLMVAAMSKSYGALRNKCAVELATA